MATNLIPTVVEAMTKGKTEECPVCGEPKDRDDWICSDCFFAKGYVLAREVQAAVRVATTKVSDEVWQRLLSVARCILQQKESAELDDSCIVKAMTDLSEFSAIPSETIFSALNTARKDLKREKEAADKHEACWQTALTAVRDAFPDGEICTGYFKENPVRFEGTIIGESMMKAACFHVQKEREAARRSLLAAELVKNAAVIFPQATVMSASVPA